MVREGKCEQVTSKNEYAAPGGAFGFWVPNAQPGAAYADERPPPKKSGEKLRPQFSTRWSENTSEIRSQAL